VKIFSQQTPLIIFHTIMRTTDCSFIIYRKAAFLN